MLFRYPGGKSKKSIVNTILGFFPQNFKEYREPFVGGGGIFFNIPTFVPRWINDIDQNLISVYFALRDRPEEFIKLCRSIKPQEKGEKLTSAKPNGKKIYNARLKAVFDELLSNPNSDPALKYLFVNRTNWAGRVNYNLPSRLYFSNPSGWNIVSKNVLEEAALILSGTKISSVDYSILLEEPGEDVLIYIDPPYFVNSNFSPMSQLYANNFTEKDHIVLCEKLRTCKHKFVISYDSDPFIIDLYKGMNINYANWKYCGTSLKEKKDGKELIITNF